jgi:hypothetical protein
MAATNANGKKESAVACAGLKPASWLWRIEEFAQVGQIISNNCDEDLKAGPIVIRSLFDRNLW